MSGREKSIAFWFSFLVPFRCCECYDSVEESCLQTRQEEMLLLLTPALSFLPRCVRHVWVFGEVSSRFKVFFSLELFENWQKITAF